jgi:hypothetical protein
MRATSAPLRVGRCRHQSQHEDHGTDAEQLMEFHINRSEQLLCQWKAQILPPKLALRTSISG